MIHIARTSLTAIHSNIQAVILAISLVIGFGTKAVTAETAPTVVTSILPVHSLVAMVMDGVGTPDLLLKGAASPHDFALRPSQARAVANADLIFWIGPDLETFLEKPVENAKGQSISLLKAPNLTLLPFREIEEFSAGKNGHGDHGHDDHGHGHAKKGHEDHDDHGHDDHGHGHAKKGHKDHDDHGHDDHGHDDHGHGHNHDGDDPHVWLDPVNAVHMVKYIAQTLASADPHHAALYQKNAAAAVKTLAELESKISASLKDMQKTPFAVFHDAYQYFEARFGLTAIGAITLNPDVPPSAEAVRRISAQIAAANAKCIFAEPQFSPKIVTTVATATGVQQGVLDPLGADIKPGPQGYLTLLGSMATAFANCK